MKIILVRHGKWYIPKDRGSYKNLVKLGFPCTRIHEDARGALSLVMKKREAEVEVVPFKDIRKDFQDKAAAHWLKTDTKQRTVSMKSGSITLATTKRAATAQGLKDLERMRPTIDEFLRRWGLSGDVVISEARGLCQLYVAFTQSRLRLPVIRTKKDVLNQSKAVLQMGTHRLLTSTDRTRYYWWLEIKAGPTWVPLQHGSCLLTDVTDPTKHIGDLMVAFNKE